MDYSAAGSQKNTWGIVFLCKASNFRLNLGTLGTTSEASSGCQANNFQASNASLHFTHSPSSVFRTLNDLLLLNRIH